MKYKFRTLAIVLFCMLFMVDSASATRKAKRKPQVSQRIINGTGTSAAEFPGFANLLIWDRVQGKTIVLNCGGYLINAYWVATAAHCVKPPNTSGTRSLYAVAFGQVNLMRTASENVFFGAEQTVNISKIIVHPGYDPRNYGSDIALIKLQSPSFFQPVQIASVAQLNFAIERGMSGTVIGRGLASPGQSTTDYILRKASVDIYRQNEQSGFANFYVYPQFVSDFMSRYVFAGGRFMNRGACYGDSGGPLFVNFGSGNTVVGHVSFGKGNCTTTSHPGAFFKVPVYANWIWQIVRTN
jgi:secreted trypsin-like serine protease